MGFGDLPRVAYIAGVRVEPNLVLAPMEGVTDLTFRRLVRAIGGCGLTVTEFVPARSLKHGGKRELSMAQFDADERPVAVQIFGRDPEIMAEGARYVQGLGATLVDLNMGCPSKRVCAHSGGSALMKEPKVAREIVRAMRAAVDIPFTVKMRAGWDAHSKNAPELAAMCEDEGADAVAVHWRTRQDNYGGERDLDTVAEVVRRLTIPVFANGDVVDLASAELTLRVTGAAGLMVGRGAIRNPWIFAQIADMQAGRAPRVVDSDERERTLLAYFDDIRARFGSDRGALGRFKKIARYFTEGVQQGDVLRQRIFHSQSAEEAIAVVHEHFRAVPRDSAQAEQP